MLKSLVSYLGIWYRNIITIEYHSFWTISRVLLKFNTINTQQVKSLLQFHSYVPSGVVCLEFRGKDCLNIKTYREQRQ